MLEAWLEGLYRDPRPALLAGDDPALSYFARRDLLGEAVPAPEMLQALPEADRLVTRQQTDGSWKYVGRPSGSVPGQNYALLETYRSLRVLVEMYGFRRDHPTLQQAANYVFSCQTAEGDIRGILGNQYMPYYHGAILELLVKAGFADDPRLIAGLDWLLAVRQDDGGWIVPAQAVPSRERSAAFWSGPPLPPARSLPHAHLATGMALRPLAAHPAYRTRPEVLRAGECLARRLFQADKYNDRKGPAYWLKFQFPFWWTSLLTALDTLGRLGFTGEEPQVARGLGWFREHQQEDGLWPTGYGPGRKAAASRCWVGLAVCRVLKQFYPGA